MIMIVVDDDVDCKTYCDIDSDSGNDSDSYIDNDSDSSSGFVLGFVLNQFFILRYLPWQLRKEKVDLENALEQEQESLVNRLWKKMEKLEKEKRYFETITFFFFNGFALYSIIFDQKLIAIGFNSLPCRYYHCDSIFYHKML